MGWFFHRDIIVYNLSDLCNHSRLAEVAAHFVFPTSQEGEATVLNRCTPELLVHTHIHHPFLAFHVLTRFVRAQLFLLDEAVVVNNFKLLPWQSHLPP